MSDYESIFKSRSLAMLVITMLSGCCIFGTTQREVEEYGNEAMSDYAVRKIIRQCDADIRKRREERGAKFQDIVRLECSKEHPFENVEFWDAANGQLFYSMERSAFMAHYSQLCSLFDERRKGWNDLLIHGYCPDCSGGSYDACYREHGLHTMSVVKTVCKQILD